MSIGLGWWRLLSPSTVTTGFIVFSDLVLGRLPLYTLLCLAIVDGTIKPQPVGRIAFTWVAFVASLPRARATTSPMRPRSRTIHVICHAETRAELVPSVFFGASLAAIWLIALGAWLATHFGAADGLVAPNDAGDVVFSDRGTRPSSSRLRR